MRQVYLDNAATTRVSDKVAHVMNVHFVKEYGNPSSVHGMGITERNVTEAAREQIGAHLKCEPSRIVFTSGATEANNIALNHYFTMGRTRGKDHIVISAFEHPSVYNYCAYLSESRGAEVTVVNPDHRGIIDPWAISKAITDRTCVVCVMAVNNEIGTIQHLTHLSSVCAKRGVPLHMDATQAIGHFKMNLGVFQGTCSFAFSGHKFHAAKGIGCLVKPEGNICSLFFGGSQEHYVRPGTENVAGIIGMSTALDEAYQNGFWEKEIKARKDQFVTELKQKVGGIVLTGDQKMCIPHIVNVSFEDVQGDVLVSMLSDIHGIYCSTGSACCNGDASPSRTLLSMGLSEKEALSSVRFSFSRYTTEEEIDYAVKSISKCVANLRGWVNIL